jgi:hypothetical protein
MLSLVPPPSWAHAGALKSFTKRINGPNLSTWTGVWEAIGQAPGSRLLPLLQSALEEVYSAEPGPTQPGAPAEGSAHGGSAHGSAHGRQAAPAPQVAPGARDGAKDTVPRGGQDVDDGGDDLDPQQRRDVQARAPAGAAGAPPPPPPAPPAGGRRHSSPELHTPPLPAGLPPAGGAAGGGARAPSPAEAALWGSGGGDGLFTPAPSPLDLGACPRQASLSDPGDALLTPESSAGYSHLGSFDRGAAGGGGGPVPPSWVHFAAEEPSAGDAVPPAAVGGGGGEDGGAASEGGSSSKPEPSQRWQAVFEEQAEAHASVHVSTGKAAADPPAGSGGEGGRVAG